MLNYYENGGLKMLDIQTFNHALKESNCAITSNGPGVIRFPLKVIALFDHWNEKKKKKIKQIVFAHGK